MQDEEHSDITLFSLSNMPECSLSGNNRDMFLGSDKLLRHFLVLCCKHIQLTYCVRSAVAQCLNRDRGVGSSSLTGGTALCP